jgi:hypothetical protein
MRATATVSRRQTSLVRSTAAVLALVLISSTAAGCGDGGNGQTGGNGKTVSARAWAKSLCWAMYAWREQIGIRGDEVQSQEPPSDLREARAEAVAYFDDTLRTTTLMGERIERAGTPDVEGGDELRDELLRTVEDLRAAYADALAEAKTFSVVDREEFYDDVRRSETAFIERVDGLGGALEDFKSKEAIAAAFSKEPECVPSG